jgi:hypothetical protein
VQACKHLEDFICVRRPKANTVVFHGNQVVGLPVLCNFTCTNVNVGGTSPRYTSMRYRLNFEELLQLPSVALNYRPLHYMNHRFAAG